MSGALALLMGAAGNAMPTLVSASAIAASATDTLVVSKPSGVQAGDLLLAIMACNDTRTWTGDTGWTEIFDTGAAPGLRAAYRIATGTEGSSFTFTMNASRLQSGIVLAYRNAAYDAVGSSAADSDGSVTAPSVTLSADGLLIAAFANATGSRTFDTPSGMAPIAADTDSDAPSFALFGQEVGAGASGTRDGVAALGGRVTGILIGIKGT